MLTDSDGVPRCVFEEMNEYMDCSALWPTTTETPTEPAGCCRGSSYKAQAKCFGLADQTSCERKDCEWLVTDEPNDCVITTTSTTTTTETPGCCKGDSMAANEKCNAIDSGDKCNARSSCEFIEFGIIDIDCVFTATDPPAEPGCCYGNPDIAYSKRWMDSCKAFGTEAECLMLTDGEGVARCAFEPMGEYEDCETVWPTTTTTTETPGCCYSDSYKGQDKCLGLDADMCARKGCNFKETDDPNDCVLTTETPTTTKTVTEEPGCCKADSVKREDMCAARDTRDKCEKSSSCVEWISGEDADCSFRATTTDEPGCCYINPDMAYSKKYQETCIAFGTERECLKLTDGEGMPRCVFEEMNEYMDCSALWPTTTSSPTEPAGCCKGSSYKAQAKCVGNMDRTSCERKECEWLVTDEPNDCVITTTSTTTTTETPGCCKGDSMAANEKCNAIDSGDKCNARSSCEFIEFGIIDIDCVFTATEP